MATPLIDRKRLLAILEAAQLDPQPHEFSYVAGGPVNECVSIRIESISPVSGMKINIAKLIRVCKSTDEAAELIERMIHTTQKHQRTYTLVLFWSFADWI